MYPGITTTMITQQMEDSRAEVRLRFTLKTYGCSNTDLVGSGLEYFKKCCSERVFSYPGDAVYYDMLHEAIHSIGAKVVNDILVEATERAKKLLDKELQLYDYANTAAIYYMPKFYFR